MNKSGILFRFDPWLLGTVFALVIGGVVMVYSASAVLALDRYGESVYFLKRQLLSLAIGLIALFGFARMDYSWWRKAAYPLLILSLLCLTAVLMPGWGAESGAAQSHGGSCLGAKAVTRTSVVDAWACEHQSWPSPSNAPRIARILGLDTHPRPRLEVDP